MPINYIKGDMVKAIAETKEEIFVHGCNCFHTMGSGIARQIREAYPEVYEADKATEYAAYHKLGGASSVFVRNNVVMNLYTQYNYGINKPQINYPAVRMNMNKLNWIAQEIFKEINKPQTINMPKIGCGLAGGDWNIVEQIIKEEFDDNAIINVWSLNE